MRAKERRVDQAHSKVEESPEANKSPETKDGPGILSDLRICWHLLPTSNHILYEFYNFGRKRISCLTEKGSSFKRNIITPDKNLFLHRRMNVLSQH